MPSISHLAVTLLTLLLTSNLLATPDQSPSSDIPSKTEAIAKTAAITPKAFKAHYKSQWKLGWFTLDIDATRTLTPIATPAQQSPAKAGQSYWQLSFQADTSAAALRETSTLLFDGQKLKPLSYQYRASGLFNEDDRDLVFYHPSQQIEDREINKVYTQAWQQQVFDNLGYMQQISLDLAAGKQAFAYPVFEKSKLKTFRFEVIGEETLNTASGKLNTIKIRQIRKKKDREIYAWFAKDHNYLMVKLLDKNKGKKRYSIDISKIETIP